jgi:23S rRNA-/tRNA-specific pseudouridylate synthase
VIVTGVMHQIRAHAAFVGLALTGDRRYGGRPTPDGFDAEFRLHHVGLSGPGGLRTEPVPLPAWARLPDEPGADRERPEP